MQDHANIPLCFFQEFHSFSYTLGYLVHMQCNIKTYIYYICSYPLLFLISNFILYILMIFISRISYYFLKNTVRLKFLYCGTHQAFLLFSSVHILNIKLKNKFYSPFNFCLITPTTFLVMIFFLFQKKIIRKFRSVMSPLPILYD